MGGRKWEVPLRKGMSMAKREQSLSMGWHVSEDPWASWGRFDGGGRREVLGPAAATAGGGVDGC